MKEKNFIRLSAADFWFYTIVLFTGAFLNLWKNQHAIYFVMNMCILKLGCVFDDLEEYLESKKSKK